MKGPTQEMQVMQAPYDPTTKSGGTTLDFAADYPGVMIAIVVFLLGCTAFFVKQKLTKKEN